MAFERTSTADLVKRFEASGVQKRIESGDALALTGEDIDLVNELDRRRKLMGGSIESQRDLTSIPGVDPAAYQMGGDFRDSASAVSGYSGNSRIEGRAAELLKRDQSFRAYREKAGVRTAPGFDSEKWLQDFFTGRSSAETRAVDELAEQRAGLTEGSYSAPGGAYSVVPYEWSADFYDLMRPKLWSHNAGVEFFDMPAARYTYPVWNQDVSPVWVGTEPMSSGTALAIDANAQMGGVVFDTLGSEYLDLTLISNLAISDAISSDGLTNLVQSTIAQKWARLIDSALVFGTAGNAGVPGLLADTGANGTGIQTLALGGTAPTSPAFVSQAAQLVRNANTEPTAILSTPKGIGALNRMAGTGGFPNFFPMPRDVAEIPQLSTTLLPDTETNAGVVTGGSASTFLVGDFTQVKCGIHATFGMQILRERYADQRATGILTSMRLSARTVWANGLVRVTGYQPTN